MKTPLNERLARLHGVVVNEVKSVEFEAPPTDSIYAIGTLILLSDGTRLSCQFWRLIKSAKPVVSIFDHRQKYGLPNQIDAISALQEGLEHKSVLGAYMNEETGDLRFTFSDEFVLEVFNFTGFEIWHLTFSDGTGELSNYAIK